ncbi:hypothetical protein C0036_20220, partial [Streptomyces sp. DJ]
MLAALARFSVRHRWPVIALWLLAVLGAGLAAQQAGGSFSNDLTLSGTDSQAAHDTLRERYPELSGDGMQVVVHSDSGADTPQVRRAVRAAVADVRGLDGVAA